MASSRLIRALNKLLKGGSPRRKKRLTSRTSRTRSRVIKKRSRAELIKPRENPLISPKQENGWEAWQTFNPGAALLNDRVHFLYRAIGIDGLSRLGYAASEDGFTLCERFPYPVYEHQVKHPGFTIFSYFSGGSFGGCEDPRIVRIGKEDKLYMTYTACDGGLRVALTSLSVSDFLRKRWRWKAPVFISPLGEVHKNWVIFPEKIHGKYAILHSLNPEVRVSFFDDLDFDGDITIQSSMGNEIREYGWDAWVRGAGPPPVKTSRGWLLFYHAMGRHDFSKYKVGAMLLDLQDPSTVICRSPWPILEPDQHYENNGFKSGVVYASAALVKGDNLLIYYGGSDSYVCVAHANLEEFLRALLGAAKPRLKRGVIKQKRT